MIRLKHNDAITFNYMSKFNGALPASYRVFSAISEAIEAGGNPGTVKDMVALDRVQHTAGGTPVQDGDQVLVEGKYFTVAIDNEKALLVLITSS